MRDTEDLFRSILNKMRDSAHGSAHLGDLSDLMRSLKKQKRVFLEQRLLQKVISWDENKAQGVWDSEETAIRNRYWFLQGYIIESSHVIGPNRTESCRQWMVLSVDCDCVRAPYVHVGKIVQMGDERQDRELLSLAATFKTTKFFPLPPFDNVKEWSIVDLETPFFIERGKAPFSTAIHSLNVDGWHILNAVLQERYTRLVDRVEAERLRTYEAGGK